MIISMIAAIGKNRELGLENKLLWHIKEDFQNFKKITMGHHLLMGRKTFESIGRALPGRTTLILTRNPSYQQEGCTTIKSLEEGIELAKSCGEDELFISGGGEIYSQCLDKCDKLYLSLVDYSGPADAFFPEYLKYEWKTLKRQDYPATQSSPHWQYLELERLV